MWICLCPAASDGGLSGAKWVYSGALCASSAGTASFTSDGTHTEGLVGAEQRLEHAQALDETRALVFVSSNKSS